MFPCSLVENMKKMNQQSGSFFVSLGKPFPHGHRKMRYEKQLGDMRALLRLGLSASASELTCHQAPGDKPDQARFSFRSVKHPGDAKLRADRRLAGVYACGII